MNSQSIIRIDWAPSILDGAQIKLQRLWSYFGEKEKWVRLEAEEKFLKSQSKYQDLSPTKDLS